jgi:GTP cyclohydrolase I
MSPVSQPSEAAAVPHSPGPPTAPEPDLDPGADALHLARVAAAFRNFMTSLGLEPNDPDLAGTDRRVARAYAELLSGLRPGSEPPITTFANTEGHRGIVSLTEIPFYSICAHHFLPFFGTAHVGYVPGDRLAGLSKLARVVDFFARRPQLQERMTEQIASFLERRLAPAGVIVLLEARHLCLEMRGVAKAEAVTTTLATRGALQSELLQRQFFARLRRARVQPSNREI